MTQDQVRELVNYVARLATRCVLRIVDNYGRCSLENSNSRPAMWVFVQKLPQYFVG